MDSVISLVQLVKRALPLSPLTNLACNQYLTAEKESQIPLATTFMNLSVAL
jgi:hypothetical protein